MHFFRKEENQGSSSREDATNVESSATKEPTVGQRPGTQSRRTKASIKPTMENKRTIKASGLKANVTTARSMDIESQIAATASRPRPTKRKQMSRPRLMKLPRLC